MAMTIGRCPALLVSLHGSGLYAAFDAAQSTAADAAAVRDFLAGQTAVQQRLVAELAADPVWRDAVQPERLAHSRALIALTDRLSLVICGGVTAVATVRAPGLPEITLHPMAPDRLLVDPWPFYRASVQVTCEARALPDRYQDEAAMRTALRAAPATTLVTELAPR